MEAKILREIYLIRHGESLGNIGMSGDSLEERADPVLSEKGEKQVEAAGKFLEAKEFDAVYSSGLKRAVQTASAIASYQKRAKSINVLPMLCEIGNSPEYKGCSLEQLKEYAGTTPINLAEEVKEGDILTVLDETPKENEGRYFERAKAVLDYMEKRYNNGEKIALVGHAGFLTYIIFYIIGYRDAQPNYDFSLHNASVTKIRFYEKGTYEFGDIVFRYINREAPAD